MKCIATNIPDVKIFEPQVFSDERGYFMESFHHQKIEEFLEKNIIFCQENESFSQRNVLRGLHYQIPPFAQSKLVRVLDGEVLDIAVDIRKNSPTFGNHVSVILSSENKRQLFIPQGFAHGFIVLSKTAVFSYKVDNYYSPQHEHGILYSDKDLGIDWNRKNNTIIISDKDTLLPCFKDAIYF